ncbi:hypothetical protein Tco_0806762 [Tanacetum coccineum]
MNLPSPPPPPPKTHVSRKLIFISLTLSLVSILFIAIMVATLLYHHHHHRRKPPLTTDNRRLFPTNLPTSDKPPPPPTLSPNFSTTSSEFLCLGTLNMQTTNVSLEGFQRMGSPELHPLPPLPRKNYRDPQEMEGDFYTDPRKTEGQKKVVTAVTIAPASVGGGVEAEVKGRASSVNQQSELHDDVESRKRGLEVVSTLSSELSSLKKAAAILTMISFQRKYES